MAKGGTDAEEVADDQVVRLAEEVATVSTRRIVTGRVRVTTTVEEVQAMAEAVLRSDAVEVTRVSIDKPIDAAPPIRTVGDVTIIPIVEEVLVIEKRLVLKEELHVRRTSSTETVQHPVLLRQQRAHVERYDEQGVLIESGPAG